MIDPPPGTLAFKHRQPLTDQERVVAVKRLATIYPEPGRVARSEDLVVSLMHCPPEQQAEVIDLWKRALTLRGTTPNEEA